MKTKQRKLKNGLISAILCAAVLLSGLGAVQTDLRPKKNSLAKSAGPVNEWSIAEELIKLGGNAPPDVVEPDQNASPLSAEISVDNGPFLPAATFDRSGDLAVLGGTGFKTPHNWKTSCSFALNPESNWIKTEFDTDNVMRVAFTAPEDGTYTLRCEMIWDVPQSYSETDNVNIAVSYRNQAGSNLGYQELNPNYNDFEIYVDMIEDEETGGYCPVYPQATLLAGQKVFLYVKTDFDSNDYGEANVSLNFNAFISGAGQTWFMAEELAKQGSFAVVPDYDLSLVSAGISSGGSAFLPMGTFDFGEPQAKLGGTGFETPHNWKTACSFALDAEQNKVKGFFDNENTKLRIEFRAPESGLYEIDKASYFEFLNPYSSSNGTLTIKAGTDPGNIISEEILNEKQKNAYPFNAGANGTPRRLHLEKGQKLFFEFSKPSATNDNNGKQFSFSFKSCVIRKVQNGTGTADHYGTILPAEELFKSGSHVERSSTGTPDFEFGLFRAEGNYNGSGLVPFSSFKAETSGNFSVGNTGEVSGWERHCAFSGNVNDGYVTAKISSSNEGKNFDRLSFVSPKSGYWTLKSIPIPVEESGGNPVFLDLGNHAAAFGQNTATLKITNSNDNSLIYNQSFWAQDESGNANLTGEFFDQIIYLNEGDRIDFDVSTSAVTFDPDGFQTVFLQFGFCLEYCADKETVISLYDAYDLNSQNNFDSNDLFSYETSFDGREWKKYKHKESNIMGGYQGTDDLMWKENCSMIINQENGKPRFSIGSSLFRQRVSFNAPAAGTYKLSSKREDNLFNIFFGENADKMRNGCIFFDIYTSSGQKIASVKYDSKSFQTSINGEPFEEYLLQQTVELNSGEKIYFEVYTDTAWFNYPGPGQKNIQVELGFNINIKNEGKIIVKGENISFDGDDANLHDISYMYQTFSYSGNLFDRQQNGDYDFLGYNAVIDDGRLMDQSNRIWRTYNAYNPANENQYSAFVPSDPVNPASNLPAAHNPGTSLWNLKELRYGNSSSGEHGLGAFEIENTVLTDSGSKKIRESGTITAIMGSGEEQKLSFVPPETGFYIIRPKGIGNGESGWIKNTGTGYDVNLKIRTTGRNADVIYNSGNLASGQTVNDKDPIVVNLIHGGDIEFVFSANGSDSNNPAKLTAAFDIISVYCGNDSDEHIFSKLYAKNPAASMQNFIDILTKNGVALAQAMTRYYNVSKEVVAPKQYGVRFSGASNTSGVTRLFDAAGMKAGVGTDTLDAANDFDNANPWAGRRRVTGGFDSSGSFSANKYEGETGYATDGSAGDVWVETPLFYYRHEYGTAGADSEEIVISELPLPGFLPSPDHVNPDGTLKRYAYTAAYPMAKVDGIATSRSGVFPETGSLDSLMSTARTLGSSYTTGTMAEWYTKCLLMWVEFGTRNLQSIMFGAQGMAYDAAHKATVSENGATRFITTAAIAEKFVVGQTICIGTGINSTSVAENRIVTGFEDVGSGNVAINFGGTPVNIVSGNVIWSSVWENGSCDDVKSSSGSLVSNTDRRFTCVYRGEESPYGNAFEWISDILVKRSGTAGEYVNDIFYLPDPTLYNAGKLTEDYIQLGYKLHTSNGYFTKFGIDPRYPHVRLPSSGGGAYNTYYSDYFYTPGYPITAGSVGGRWNETLSGGPCYWSFSNNPSGSSNSRYARLSYHQK